MAGSKTWKNIGVQGNNLCNKALVFIAKGIRTAWKQPLGYVFVHRGAPASALKDLLFQCCKALGDAGLEPVAIVCDQRSHNLYLFVSLVSTEEPYADVDRSRLFILDAPHLLKACETCCLSILSI
ncbi:hypothetical protein HPB48_023999 [Haemaphysalis longicornis]|uniref:Transposable element P transposase-like RNase H domain-containing protein n=1 Tax=Haemaphysalis longicornis TaxID=44386 RepID=A0A9J6H8V5_HAELO|nr:hypothetical protein HPB48_023999 [Haemaphysalis longicornis]